MRLVCLDTCTQAISVAAMEDGKILREKWDHQKSNHSEILLPMLSEMMEELNWGQKTVDCWAVVNGPGSFTGVRIGVSTARALAHGWNKPIVAVNSLETIAYQVKERDKRIVSMLDARRGQVYAAVFEWKDSELMEICAPVACGFEEIIGHYSDKPCVLIGDGALANKNNLSSENIVFAPEEMQYIHSRAGAEIAWKKWMKGMTQSYRDLEPLYVREPQAVRDLKK